MLGPRIVGRGAVVDWYARVAKAGISRVYIMWVWNDVLVPLVCSCGGSL